MPIAARSFTLPPGFRYSSLAKISADPGGANFFICSMGVSPTSFEMSSLRRRREVEVNVSTPYRVRNEGGSVNRHSFSREPSGFNRGSTIGSGLADVSGEIYSSGITEEE